MKYLILDYELSLWSQGHKILFFDFTLYGYYVVQIWAKSIKPYRIYRKMKYLLQNGKLVRWAGYIIALLNILLAFPTVLSLI